MKKILIGLVAILGATSMLSAERWVVTREYKINLAKEAINTHGMNINNARKITKDLNCEQIEVMLDEYTEKVLEKHNLINNAYRFNAFDLIDSYESILQDHKGTLGNLVFIFSSEKKCKASKDKSDYNFLRRNHKGLPRVK